MPAKCDRCGQPSYVKYVKPNPSIICDKCEDQDRKRKDVLDVWDIIKYHNRQWRRYYATSSNINHLDRL